MIGNGIQAKVYAMVSGFPDAVTHKGKQFYATGKTGRNNATGEQVAEYEASDGSRIWANQAGEYRGD